ncbi:site-2 protease family protein, partial [Staphylococcus aureus]|uniref:site-2 protease family protein n=1 Tax=Staphylococcus aureus TaxID=1280 RepID=UPI0037D9BCE8
MFTPLLAMFPSIFTPGFSFDILNPPLPIYHNLHSLLKPPIITLIPYTPFLTLNLAIINLIPIPPLHGAPILFVIY